MWAGGAYRVGTPLARYCFDKFTVPKDMGTKSLGVSHPHMQYSVDGARQPQPGHNLVWKRTAKPESLWKKTNRLRKTYYKLILRIYRVCVDRASLRGTAWNSPYRNPWNKRDGAHYTTQIRSMFYKDEYCFLNGRIDLIGDGPLLHMHLKIHVAMPLHAALPLKGK